MTGTVKVQMPDGNTRTCPVEWIRRDFSDRPLRQPIACVDLPGYRVEQTVDGKFFAFETQH